MQPIDCAQEMQDKKLIETYEEQDTTVSRSSSSRVMAPTPSWTTGHPVSLQMSQRSGPNYHASTPFELNICPVESKSSFSRHWRDIPDSHDHLCRLVTSCCRKVHDLDRRPGSSDYDG